MNALAKLALQVVVSPEAKALIENIVADFNDSAKKMKEIRKSLAEADNTLISALFDQIHFARQLKMMCDIDTLENKFKDDAYAKLTTLFWSKVSSRVIKDLYAGSLSAVSMFDDEYVFVKQKENTTEFTLENVILGVTKALQNDHHAKALQVHAAKLGIDKEHGFISARGRLSEGSLKYKANSIVLLQESINSIIEKSSRLKESYYQEIDDQLVESIVEALDKNEGAVVRLTKSLNGKLFKNGSVQVLFEPGIVDVLNSYI